MFSYLGASCQERITGRPLSAGESVVAGTVTHDRTALLDWRRCGVRVVLRPDLECEGPGMGALWGVMHKCRENYLPGVVTFPYTLLQHLIPSPEVF